MRELVLVLRGEHAERAARKRKLRFSLRVLVSSQVDTVDQHVTYHASVACVKSPCAKSRYKQGV
jgi:hypothetical protein